MDLLTSLGVNSTLFVQFAIFLAVYAVLYFVLFKPYFLAFHERSDRTVGKTELAERFIAETKALEDVYASRAQEVNSRYKAVYDQTRTEAIRQYDEMVNGARQSAREIVEQAREKVSRDLVSAKDQLNKEVGAVATLVSNKLLGKDLSL